MHYLHLHGNEAFFQEALKTISEVSVGITDHSICFQPAAFGNGAFLSTQTSVVLIGEQEPTAATAAITSAQCCVLGSGCGGKPLLCEIEEGGITAWRSRNVPMLYRRAAMGACCSSSQCR